MKQEDQAERCAHCIIREMTEYDTHLCHDCHEEQMMIWEKETEQLERQYRRNAL
jgi:hypothetical protein